ncbi:MAG TPA: type II secretion system F family protein [Gammaproteobacteria bacterium]|jgi:type IV pilus assembly protein PilC|nr:type II secretion system F family protein [Gammaproteobacteria bacterium]
MSDGKQVFQYTGINNQGKRLDGVVQAIDLKDAQGELVKMGIEVINLQPKQQFGFSGIKLFSKKKKIKTKDILLFTRYISTMLAAGLPIIQSLDIISKDQENPAMKDMIVTIRNNITGGKTLAESFRLYPQHFNDMYCNLISSGEKSGTLDKILKRLGNYLERSETLKRKVKKAMIYPIAILTVALGVSLVLLIFVVPQFDKMFSSFGAQLPLFTRMVVNLSNFLRDYWYIFLGGIFGGVWGLKKYIKGSEAAQVFIDRYILKVYIVGDVIQKSVVARFARTLATTLEAGMPIVESMKAMALIMGNKIYSKAVLDICNEVVNGKQLSVAMESTKLFPSMAIQMISVGEASGSLSDMLNKVADYYEEEVNGIVDNLSSLLEPIIMVILGVIVGSFVVAMYLPIFKIGSLF